jgi:hypothetical protein
MTTNEYAEIRSLMQSLHDVHAMLDDYQRGYFQKGSNTMGLMLLMCEEANKELGQWLERNKNG